jgi:hypothetical protein
MQRKAKLLLVAAWLLACLPAAAQSVFTSVSWQLLNPPQPVPSASVTLVGNPGPATYYFWIVANSTMGSANPAGPFLLANGPNAFSSSNYAALSWAPGPNATTYDILLTSSISPPTGACNCAIATAQTGTTFNVQTNTLSSYTVSSIDSSNFLISSQNVQSAAGASKLQWTLPNGTVLGSLDTNGQLIVNSCIGCGGGGGGLTPGNAYAVVNYGPSSGGTAGYPDAYLNSSPTLLLATASGGVQSYKGFTSGGGSPATSGVLNLGSVSGGVVTGNWGMTPSPSFAAPGYYVYPPNADAAGPLRMTGGGSIGSPDQQTIGLVPGDETAATAVLNASNPKYAGSDIGASINNAIASSDCGSACKIHINHGTYNYSTTITGGVPGKVATLDCDPEGVVLNFTPNTGVAYTANSVSSGTYNWGVGSCHFTLPGGPWLASHTYSAGAIIEPVVNNTVSTIGMVYQIAGACTTGSSEPTWPTSGSVSNGSCTINQLGTLIALQLGGSSGAANWNGNGVDVTGDGLSLQVLNNTWGVSFTGNYHLQTIEIAGPPITSNSGESMSFGPSGVISGAGGGHTTGNCAYVNWTNANVYFLGNSFDGCQRHFTHGLITVIAHGEDYQTDSNFMGIVDGASVELVGEDDEKDDTAASPGFWQVTSGNLNLEGYYCYNNTGSASQMPACIVASGSGCVQEQHTRSYISSSIGALISNTGTCTGSSGGNNYGVTYFNSPIVQPNGFFDVKAIGQQQNTVFISGTSGTPYQNNVTLADFSTGSVVNKYTWGFNTNFDNFLFDSANLINRYLFSHTGSNTYATVTGQDHIFTIGGSTKLDIGTSVTTAPVFNATIGFQIGGAAPTGHCLVGNGTDYVDSSSCGSGGSTSFQVNGTPLTSSSTVNYENAAAFNGLTLTFANPSAGNVQLGVTGTLGNAGLTNSSVTYNGQNVALGGTGNVNAGAAAHSVALNEGAGAAMTGVTGINNTVLVGQTGADPIFSAVPAGALPSNVVTSVTNDTNVTGSIAANNLTLGWTGTLAKTRTLATTVYTDQNNTFSAGFLLKVQSNSSSAGYQDAGTASSPPCTSALAGTQWWNTSKLYWDFCSGWTDNASTPNQLYAAHRSSADDDQENLWQFQYFPAQLAAIQNGTATYAIGLHQGDSDTSGFGLTQLSYEYPLLTMLQSNVTGWGNAGPGFVTSQASSSSKNALPAGVTGNVSGSWTYCNWSDGTVNNGHSGACWGLDNTDATASVSGAYQQYTAVFTDCYLYWATQPSGATVAAIIDGSTVATGSTAGSLGGVVSVHCGTIAPPTTSHVLKAQLTSSATATFLGAILLDTTQGHGVLMLKAGAAANKAADFVTNPILGTLEGQIETDLISSLGTGIAWYDQRWGANEYNQNIAPSAMITSMTSLRSTLRTAMGSNPMPDTSEGSDNDDGAPTFPLGANTQCAGNACSMQQYDKAINSMANTVRDPFISFLRHTYPESQNTAATRGIYATDNIHLSPTGQTMMANIVLARVQDDKTNRGKVNVGTFFTSVAKSAATQLLASDFCGNELNYTNFSAATFTLPQAGTGPVTGCVLKIVNVGGGTITLQAPTSVQINAQSAGSITIVSGEEATIYTKGADNYWKTGAPPALIAGTNITLTPGATGTTITASGGGGAAGYSWTSVSKTGAYTIVAADFSTTTSFGNSISEASIGGGTFTLPASTSLPSAGSYVRVYNSNSGTLTLAAGSGTSLLGTNCTTFTQYQGAEVWWDGSNYRCFPWAGSGGGSTAFSALGSGTNTTAAMLVGTGSSLGTTGSGTIAATSVPASGITTGTVPSGVTTNYNGQIDLRLGVCQGTGAAIAGNFLAATAPSPVCLTGTNTNQGASQFTATGQLLQDSIILPSDWSSSGTFKFDVLFTSASAGGSGNVVWNFTYACVANTGASIDPSFAAAQTVSVAAGTNNLTNFASLTATISGCAANNIMFYKWGLDGTTTAAGNENALHARIDYVRAQVSQ